MRMLKVSPEVAAMLENEATGEAFCDAMERRFRQLMEERAAKEVARLSAGSGGPEPWGILEMP